MKAYAAYYDHEIRRQSSSGGIFSLLASQSFDAVYGAAMTQDCYGAEFVRIGKGEDLSCLRGSKYLQARIGDAYHQVKKDLAEDRHVLFSGTACQINGLKNYLDGDDEKLVCVDVICHGVPSPEVWRRYLLHQEKKQGKIHHVNFRCKEISWKHFGIKENDRYIPIDQDVFMRMFLNNYDLRPACYSCKVKQDKKSDITIGDFWGIENICPEMDDDVGTSVIITRTKKGEKLFEAIRESLVWKEVSYDDAVKDNPAEYLSVDKPPERAEFFMDLDRLSFEEMIGKYTPVDSVSSLRKILRSGKRYLSKMLGNQ